MRIHKLLGWNLIALFTLLVLASSCGNDPCQTIVPCVNGECREGECACDSLWEGLGCDVLETTKFVGSWTVGDICNNAEVYDASISEASTSGQIRFDQLGPDRLPVFAIVDGHLLAISEQAYGQAVIGGSGGIDTVNQIITLDYEVDYGQGITVNCLTSLEK